MRAMRTCAKKKECVNEPIGPFTTFTHCAYGYNIRNELISAAKSVGGDDPIAPQSPTSTTECAYQYDDIGNRESSSERGTNSAYTANNLNQYTSISNFASSASFAAEFTPQFDDDGNQTLVKTSTGIWEVQYNGENRPILWSNGSTNIVMSFDRMGRRVTKNNQRFIYNGYLQIVDNNGNAYVWDPTEKVATRPLVWNSSTFQPFNFSTAYYTHDGNKNVSEVVAEDGDIAAHYEYSPFGAITSQCGTVGVTNPWCFSSEFADDDTATVYYNYRHYESVMGKWTSMDPMMQFVNPYVFGGNCVSYCFDWIGLESVPITYTYGYHDSRKIAEISYSVNRLPCPDGGVSIDRIHLTLSPNEFSSDKDFLQNLQVFFIRNLEAYDLPIPFKLLDVDFEAQGEVVDSWSEQSGNYLRRCIKERLWVNILERGFVFNFYIWDWATMEHEYQLGNSAFVTACGPWCCKEKK